MNDNLKQLFHTFLGSRSRIISPKLINGSFTHGQWPGDHENPKGLENHAKAGFWEIEIQFCNWWVLKFSGKWKWTMLRTYSLIYDGPQALRASPTHSLYELPASRFARSPAKWSEGEAGGGANHAPGKSPRHTVSGARNSKKLLHKLRSSSHLNSCPCVASATTVAGGESLTANSKNVPRAGVLLQGPAA